MRLLLVVGLLSFCASVQAAPKLTIDDLKALALRSPNVFDTFFGYQEMYETQLPRGFFEGEAVVGPKYEISVDGEATPVQVAGGQLSAGSVPWTWADQAGLRLGADMYSTNLTPEGGAMEDGWGYRSVLFYASAFDRAMPWSATLGVYVLMRPVTTVVNGERVFSRTHTQPSTSSSGSFEYSSDNTSKTTEVESVQGFVHGTIPWIGLTTGFLFDDKGIRKINGYMDVIRADLWESIGPQFAAIPQLQNYQLGLQATRFRAWEWPLALSTEATMRYEERGGVAFDHALFKTELTLFEDNPNRVRVHRSREFSRDFHLRLELRGSYYNLREIRQPWGWGVHLDALSMGFGPVEIRFGVGGGHNYYEDVVMLPLSDVTNFQFILGIGV